MRRHLVMLVVLTVVLRGWMMVSYPMSAADDNQAAQLYLIDQLLDGNPLIGNLRYQTGYAYLIAPVVAAAGNFERIDDRIVLLVQSALSAAIPFMVYDIIRRMRENAGTALPRAEREAFIVALVVLLDPFGAQWAHFWQPEWGIAFSLILAFWLIERGGWKLRYTIAAGMVLGITCLMRLNMIPVAAGFGVMLLARQSSSLRQRFLHFAALGATCGGVLLLYLLLIQQASTGTLRPSCISGISLLESVESRGLRISAENGAESARYLDLLAHRAPQEILFLSDTYYRWQQPDAWATQDEIQAFLNNRSGDGYPVSSYTLAYYLGPCAADDLMRGVFFESVSANPVQWARETMRVTLAVLTQSPVTPGFGEQMLPTPDALHYGERDIAGFRQASDSYYTGEWVWTPGIQLYSALFPILNLSKWLTLPALVWALFSRKWFYVTAAVLLLVAAASLSAVDAPEPRIYAAVYPLWTILIGGMIAALWHRLTRQ